MSSSYSNQTAVPLAKDPGAHTKHARRIYVGGIPPNSTENEISKFFNDIICDGVAPVQLDQLPVLSVYLNLDKCFAFVELSSIELTTACMNYLDGVSYSHRGGTCNLRIRRPNDFKQDQLPPNLGPTPVLNLNKVGVIQSTVPDGPGKVFIGGLPYHWTDDQVKELLAAIGTLKAFHLIRDPGSITSKGYAFCEYQEPTHTDLAIQAFNGYVLGEKTLTVRVAESKTAQPINPMMNAVGLGMGMGIMGTAGIPPPPPPAPVIPQMPPTKVIRLENMVTKEELQDDGEYEDIMDDIKQECSRYGAVASICIPRAKSGYPESSEGSVFVEFHDSQSSRNAVIALLGRKYAERTVNVTYFDEIKYQNRFFH